MCSQHSGIYQRRVMPYCVIGGCSMPTFSRMRQKIVPKAEGVVAEIGFGSGLNLPYYDPAKVSLLIAIDPDPAMLGIARKQIGKYGVPLELLQARGEELPLAYARSRIPEPPFAKSAACSSPRVACCLSNISAQREAGAAVGRIG